MPQQTHHEVNGSIEILEALKRAEKVLIPLHLNPDGDAAGSVLALKHLLDGWGKSVKAISADPLAKNLLFLPGAREIEQTDLFDRELSRYSLLIFADANKPSRYTHKESYQLPKGVTTICIDHHPAGVSEANLIAEHPTLSYIYPEASSTAELLFDLMKKWKVEVTPEIAQCLLTGIVTDTNRFQHGTTPNVLEKAAELMRLGGNLTETVFRAYRSWPPNALSLWTALLGNAKLKDNVLYTTLSQPELKKIGIKRSELSNARAYTVSELLRSIEGTKAAAIFMDEGEKIHVNLRARTEIDVGRVAKTLGGGGHKRSAAFDFKGTLEEIVDKTLKLLSNM